MTPAGQPTNSEQTHRRNPGLSSPNEPGDILTANLKDLEPANLATGTLQEVTTAAEPRSFVKAACPLGTTDHCR